MNAESLTTALEAAPAGEPWADALAAARAAVAADRAAALAELFPTEIAPTTADAIAEYGWRTDRLGPVAYGAQLADVHARALAGHPDLARLLRSQDAIADVELAAARTATPADHRETHATAGARAAAVARQSYQLAIARQVADVPGHALAPAARRLLAADALDARIGADQARREDHAKAELARQAAERRAAARAVADKTAELVRDAEMRAADAARVAGMAAHEFRILRARAFVERLSAAAIAELRVGQLLFGAQDIVRNASEWSGEQLAIFEAALARHEVPA